MDIYYRPETEDDWVAFGLTFVTTLEGQGPTYSVNVGTIENLREAYDGFVAARAITSNLNTRTQPAVAAKDSALRAFHELCMPVVASIRESRSLTPEQKKAAGVRPTDGTRTPAQTPTLPPEVSAFVTGEQSLRVIARDATVTSKRRKPGGVGMVEVRLMRGPAAVGSPEAWPEMVLDGKTTVDRIYPDLAGDATVWVSCAWWSTVKRRGPFSKPVSVRLAGSGVQPAGESATPGMKIAA